VYALIVATAIGLAVLARIYLRAETDKQRKDLRLIDMAVNEAVNIQADGAAALLGEGPEQQAEGGQDDDQAHEVPTAMFQSINAFAVMLCGMVLAWLVKESVGGNTLSFTSHASTMPQSITAKALIDWNIAVGTS
jgi:POT family proton-dependent oligopeptide transporter